MRCEVLVAGEASGSPILLAEPLSFWGGFDATAGTVMDRWHPGHGSLLTGRILMMEEGRGSSSGASVLAEAIRLGTAPAAILTRRRDPIAVTGALVALQLYGKAMPVLVIADEADWLACAKAPLLDIGAEGVVGLE